MNYFIILTSVNWFKIIYLVYIKLSDLTSADHLYIQNKINSQIIQEQDLRKINREN